MVPDEWSGTLHDSAWLATQAAGFTANVVKHKNDGRNQAPTLSISAGAGPSGEDCLAVTTETGSNGLPGLWILPSRNAGSGVPITWDTAHPVASYETNIHKVRMLCKWPTGFRISRASDLPPNWPNEDNLVFGTYVANETDIQSGGFESNNWHFYHRAWIRHDLNDGNWVTVECGSKPDHQRNVNALVPANIAKTDIDGTALATAQSITDGYWGFVTRFYIDHLVYTASPEIALPYTWLIAGIWGVEETPDTHYTITPTDYVEGNDYTLIYGTDNRDFSFTIQEAKGVEDDCEFTVNGYYPLRPVLKEGGSPITSPIHFTANETKSLVLNVEPDLGLSRTVEKCGVTFLPKSHTNSSASFKNRDDADTTVENRWHPELGQGQFGETGFADTMVWIHKG
jgi:hypothetical protein